MAAVKVLVARIIPTAPDSCISSSRASRGVEPWLHPYFWAVYTSVGDDRTR